MLTPKDLRDPRVKSGYRFVHVVRSHGQNGYADGPDKYVAVGARRPQGDVKQHGGSVFAFRGPRRATAVQAAQDRCDYINGQIGATLASLPSYDAPVIDMGGSKRHAPVPEEVKVEREQYVGPHDLYDVLVVSANGEIVCRKVGITARGKLRYSDICTTWGCSIKPVSRAKTYPSKAAALEAEAARVAEVCTQPEWRRVAKEAFAPVNSSAQLARAA